MAVEFGLIALPPVPSGVHAPLLTMYASPACFAGPLKPPGGIRFRPSPRTTIDLAGGRQLCRRVLLNGPVEAPRPAVEPKPAARQIGDDGWRGLLPRGCSAGADERGQQQHRGNHDTASIHDLSPHKA